MYVFGRTRVEEIFFIAVYSSITNFNFAYSEIQVIMYYYQYAFHLFLRCAERLFLVSVVDAEEAETTDWVFLSLITIDIPWSIRVSASDPSFWNI